MKVGETCIGCYYLVCYAGQSYCCLSEPDIDEDGLCNSKLIEEDLADIDNCQGHTLDPYKYLKKYKHF